MVLTKGGLRYGNNRPRTKAGPIPSHHWSTSEWHACFINESSSFSCLLPAGCHRLQRKTTHTCTPHTNTICSLGGPVLFSRHCTLWLRLWGSLEKTGEFMTTMTYMTSRPKTHTPRVRRLRVEDRDCEKPEDVFRGPRLF
jgi:hypothetical protein